MTLVKRRRPYKKRLLKRRTALRRKRAIYKRNSPLPLVQFGRFRYFEQQFSTATTGALSTYIYSANGMYDCDITGTGHQPRGFDQLMPMYDHYAVLSSSIHINVANASTAAILFGICPVDTATARTSVNDYIEDRKSKWTIVAPINSGSCVKSLSHFADIGKFLGRVVKYEDDLKGTISANPTDGVYWHVFISTVYSTDTTSVSWAPVIDYSAILLEPHLPAQS